MPMPMPGPTTDLTGNWRAEPDRTVAFELTIGDDDSYSWTVAPQGAAPTTISGTYGLDGDVLILQNKDQGDLAGRVASGGADRFTFVPTAAPPGDPGLTFDRSAPASP